MIHQFQLNRPSLADDREIHPPEPIPSPPESAQAKLLRAARQRNHSNVDEALPQAISTEIELPNVRDPDRPSDLANSERTQRARESSFDSPLVTSRDQLEPAFDSSSNRRQTLESVKFSERERRRTLDPFDSSSYRRRESINLAPDDHRSDPIPESIQPTTSGSDISNPGIPMPPTGSTPSPSKLPNWPSSQPLAQYEHLPDPVEFASDKPTSIPIVGL